MLHCEYCERASESVRQRWFEAWDSPGWERPKFFDADICDECNAARKVPMVNQKPSLGGPLTEEERAIIREWGELPEYWWRQSMCEPCKRRAASLAAKKGENED